jgi:hypothetical protein
MERTTCRACGVNMMTYMPAPAESRLPVPWKEVGTSLALSLGALALRGGLRLARHLWEQRARPAEHPVQTSSPGRVKKWLARREEPEQAPAPQPQVRMWGRRMWGRRERDGSGQFEVQEFYWQTPNGED